MIDYIARPTKAQADWADMEMGLFIHWFPTGSDHELDTRRLTDPAYRREVAQLATCSELDTDQWAQSAVDLGAKYIVFVAKHSMGFCRWQTDTGDFGMKQAPYMDGKGDPMALLVQSCKKFGLKLGVYIAGWSDTYAVGNAGVAIDSSAQENYNRVYRAWLTELLTKYGEIVEVWFDGSLEIDVGDILHKYAPNAMVFQSKYATIRWVGQEEGYASDPAWNGVNRYDALSGVATERHGNPDGEMWLPLECDARLRQRWDYLHDLSRNRLHTLDELMRMYYRSVGHGAMLLINQAPNRQGRIIDEDMAQMKAFGDEIRRRFARPIAETRGDGAEILLDFGRETLVDHIVTMEDIKRGERVRAYRVEGKCENGWRALCAGTAIGHKKIDYFPEARVTAIRLRVTLNKGTPHIRALSAYHVGEIPEDIGDAQFDEHKIGEWGTEMFDPDEHSARFRYAIGAFVDEAGQYLIRFTPERDSAPVKIDEVWLEINGVRCDGYARPGDNENEYRVYLNGVADDIAFYAVSSYANHPHLSGSAWIRRER